MVKSKLNLIYFHQYPFLSGYIIHLKFSGFICFCLHSRWLFLIFLDFQKICITLACFQKSKLYNTVHSKKCYFSISPHFPNPNRQQILFSFWLILLDIFAKLILKNKCRMFSYFLISYGKGKRVYYRYSFVLNIS